MMDQRAKFTPLGLKAEYVGTAQEDPGVVHPSFGWGCPTIIY